MYNFGEKECKISWRDFLSLETSSTKLYRKDFNDFYSLYEYLDLNKKNISHLLFDGYEYFLEKGVLHNLYGAALIKHCDDPKAFFQGTSNWFYIDGKLVHDSLNTIPRGCKKLEDFQNNEIFHHKEISGIPSGRNLNTGVWYRRIEGRDYTITLIDLKKRIDLDIRKKKLIQINCYVNR